MAFIRAVICGVGAYLPKKVLSNHDLSRLVDTSDSWIRERTGIEQRHIAADDELTSGSGIAAARQALVRAGVDPVGRRPDRLRHRHPGSHLSGDGGAHSGGPWRHQGRGLRCAGACARASSMPWPSPTTFCALGQFKRAIVVGAEVFSRILDWKDRSTCVLFGDGAGRWCWRRRPSSATATIAAFLPPASALMDASRSCCTSTVVRARPRPRDTCA